MMAAVEITLAILQSLLQLAPAAQAAYPVLQKVVQGQTITEAELKQLEDVAAALNAQVEQGLKGA